MDAKDEALKQLELKRKVVQLTEGSERLALMINDGEKYPITIMILEEVRETLRVIQVGICPHSIFAGGACALCGASYAEAFSHDAK